MNRFNEKDQQIAQSILCKICKNPFEDPIQLPCSENICHSHLNDYVKIDQKTHQNYFDCCFCEQQHSLIQGFEFIPSKNLGLLIRTFFENFDDYSELYNESKKLLKELIDFDKTFKEKHQNDLNEYFSCLKLKVDLKREEIILKIHTASDELLVEINEIEKHYLNKLKRIHSELDLEELNVKIINYDEELKKFKIDLDEWTQISEDIKQDFAKLNKNKEDSYKFVSSKNEIKLEDDSSNKDFKYLFGQIGKNLFLKRRLIIGSGDKSIKIWDIESGECIKIIDAHTNPVSCLQLLDEHKFASGSLDKTIKIWDLKTFECLQTLNGHSNRVECLKKINEKELMSGSKDSTIKIWNLNSGDCMKTLQGHAATVNSLELTNDKKLILSCSDDKTIKIWNYENGECLNTLTGHSNWVICLTLINNKIISGSEGEIKIWNMDSGECLKILTHHHDCVLCIKPFKENQFISCSLNGKIKLWNIESGNCIKTIVTHDGGVWALEVSEDGQIVCGSIGGSIEIWNIENDECKKSLTGDSYGIRSLIYIS